MPGFLNPLHSMPWLQGLLVVSSLLSLYLLFSAPNCIFWMFMSFKLKHLCFRSSVKIPNKLSHWVFFFFFFNLLYFVFTFGVLWVGIRVGGYKNNLHIAGSQLKVLKCALANYKLETWWNFELSVQFQLILKLGIYLWK